MISISDKIPKALKRTPIGSYLFTYFILQTILGRPLLSILIATLKIAGSEDTPFGTDLISLTQGFF
jgi:hypothetical protein